jgi:hypothetical protein
MAPLQDLLDLGEEALMKACAGRAGDGSSVNHCKSSVARGGANGAQAPAARWSRSAKIGNQTDRRAHSRGEPPAGLAGRLETRTAPIVTWGGDAEPAGALFG